MFDSRVIPNESTSVPTADLASGSPVLSVLPTKPRRSRRASVLRWLRQTHLYLGLWGALLGMLFGATGIILNHRAVLRLPVVLSQQKTVQMALPPAGFSSPAQMALWLQTSLKIGEQKPIEQKPIEQKSAEQRPGAQKPGEQKPGQIKILPPQRLQWGAQEVLQPERWQIRFSTPQRSVNAEYIPGNRFVQLEQSSATVIGTLARLHMASGASAFWVILSDTIAASLIVLSLTGLLLWTQLHTVRTLGVLTSLGALLATLCYAWSW